MEHLTPIHLHCLTAEVEGMGEVAKDGRAKEGGKQRREEILMGYSGVDHEST